MAGGTLTATVHSQDRNAVGPAELEILAGARLFAGIARNRLQDRLRLSGELNLRPGATLVELGQRYPAIYLLLAGRLALYADEDARIAIAHLGPGDTIGEIVMIDDEAAAPAIVATERSRLLGLAPQHLAQLMRDEHRIALNLVGILAERARSSHSGALEGFRYAAQPRLITSIDPVTGLHNRRWVDDMFLRQIDRCAREGHPACMALIGIDRFGTVSETFGPQAGDLVLAQVARLMQKQFRPGDLLARSGATQFAVLLPSTRLQAAMAALERLRIAVEATQTAVAQRTTVKVRISAGIAAWREGWSLEELTRCARQAFERAEAGGGNSVAAAEPD